MNFSCAMRYHQSHSIGRIKRNVKSNVPGTDKRISVIYKHWRCISNASGSCGNIIFYGTSGVEKKGGGHFLHAIFRIFSGFRRVSFIWMAILCRWGFLFRLFCASSFLFRSFMSFVLWLLFPSLPLIKWLANTTFYAETEWIQYCVFELTQPPAFPFNVYFIDSSNVFRISPIFIFISL